MAFLFWSFGTSIVTSAIIHPLENDLKLVIIIAHKGYNIRESFISFGIAWFFEVGISTLNVSGMKIQIIDFYIDGVDKLW